MKQDVFAKSRASAARPTGTVAGVVRVTQSRPMSSSLSPGTARASGLNQLEADLIMKNRARPSGPATAVGVAQAPQSQLSNWSDSIGARSAVGGSQQGRGASTSAGGRDSRRSLQNLEQGISAKTRGSTISSSASRSPSCLQQMEDDVVTKNRARSFVTDPTPFSKSVRADSTQRSSMSDLEDDVVAKRPAQPSSLAPSSTAKAAAREKAMAASWGGGH